MGLLSVFFCRKVVRAAAAPPNVKIDPGKGELRGCRGGRAALPIRTYLFRGSYRAKEKGILFGDSGSILMRR